MLEVNGKIPMRWWDNVLNFGDLLGPWLVRKMTGKDVVWTERTEPHYLVVGSILGRTARTSVVWGVGSFGTERKERLKPNVKYLAVRGPITRSKLEMHGIPCPRVYGDPALLVADYYKPEVEKKYELGVVLRWSEKSRKRDFEVPGVKVIDLLTDDVEGTLDDFLACKKIISTSLHGLIIADAYRIPNAWLAADTGAGKEYKFWDYLVSVGKSRPPAVYDITAESVTLDKLMADFHFDDRPITIDLDLLRQACPFLNRSPEIVAAEELAMRNAAVIRRRREKKEKELAAAAAAGKTVEPEKSDDDDDDDE